MLWTWKSSSVWNQTKISLDSYMIDDQNINRPKKKFVWKTSFCTKRIIQRIGICQVMRCHLSKTKQHLLNQKRIKYGFKVEYVNIDNLWHDFVFECLNIYSLIDYKWQTSSLNNK